MSARELLSTESTFQRCILCWYCWAILSGGRFSELRAIYQDCRALTFALARLSCIVCWISRSYWMQYDPLLASYGGLSVRPSVSLRIVAKRYILQQKCLKKSIEVLRRNTILQLSTHTPAISPQASQFFNCIRWCHLANKLKKHCEQTNC